MIRTSSEEFLEAWMTVGFLPLLLECALVELLEAERADEVLWMEFLVHGGDATATDRLVAAGAEGAALGVEVALTVRQAIEVEEAADVEWRSTFLYRTHRRDTCTLEACHLSICIDNIFASLAIGNCIHVCSSALLT